MLWWLPHHRNRLLQLIVPESRNRGRVAATRVLLGASNREWWTADRGGLARLGQMVQSTISHHFVVVEFAEELIKGTGLRFLRLERFQCEEGSSQVLDRAKLYGDLEAALGTSGADMPVAEQLTTAASSRATIGDILGIFLQVHDSWPEYDVHSTRLFKSEARSLNCQGFAHTVLSRIIQQYRANASWLPWTFHEAHLFMQLNAAVTAPLLRLSGQVRDCVRHGSIPASIAPPTPRASLEPNPLFR